MRFFIVSVILLACLPSFAEPLVAEKKVVPTSLKALLKPLGGELCLPDGINIGTSRDEILKLQYPERDDFVGYEPKLIFRDLCDRVDGKLIFTFSDNSSELDVLLIAMKKISPEKQRKVLDEFTHYLGEQDGSVEERQKNTIYHVTLWHRSELRITISTSEVDDRMTIRVSRLDLPIENIMKLND
jgi:hypothetical protein